MGRWMDEERIEINVLSGIHSPEWLEQYNFIPIY